MSTGNLLSSFLEPSMLAGRYSKKLWHFSKSPNKIMHSTHAAIKTTSGSARTTMSQIMNTEAHREDTHREQFAYVINPLLLKARLLWVKKQQTTNLRISLLFIKAFMYSESFFCMRARRSHALPLPTGVLSIPETKRYMLLYNLHSNFHTQNK